MNFSEMPYTHHAVQKETGETITVKYNPKTKEYMSCPLTSLNTDYWKLTEIGALFDAAMQGKRDLIEAVNADTLHKSGFLLAIKQRANDGDIFAHNMMMRMNKTNEIDVEQVAYQSVLALLDTKNELQKELLHLKMHSTTRVIL
jgi:hypothetical protein